MILKIFFIKFICNVNFTHGLGAIPPGMGPRVKDLEKQECLHKCNNRIIDYRLGFPFSTKNLFTTVGGAHFTLRNN